MKRAKVLLSAAVAASLALGAGCASKSHEHHKDSGAASAAAHHHENMWASVSSAVAVVHPTAGNNAHGWVKFEQVDAVVHVVAHIEGLEPNSTHGFHIHEFGDCSAADGTSAGGHYNPEGHQHAGPDAMSRHAGDLGNLTADAGGVAHKEMNLDNISVAGLKNPVIGRGVIIHAKADDLKTQPTGDAGGRIGCGVIGIAKAAASMAPAK